MTDRKYLNWRPSLPVNTMADIAGHDPWDAFPGRDTLGPADAGAVSEAVAEARNPYLKRELDMMLGILDAGGSVRRVDVARGRDRVE